HHATEACMLGRLREHHVGQNLAAPVGMAAHHRGRGFIACRLDAENEHRASISVPIPKFASLCGTLLCELRNPRDTSKSMTLVRFLDLKFLHVRAEICRNFKSTALERYRDQAATSSHVL